MRNDQVPLLKSIITILFVKVRDYEATRKWHSFGHYLRRQDIINQYFDCCTIQFSNFERLFLIIFMLELEGMYFYINNVTVI